ncbi:MAG: LPS-assembly protein LptD [Rhodoferax sp.]|nr:LPS-assembly protein LptD [Rhodoferax sp.]
MPVLMCQPKPCYQPRLLPALALLGFGVAAQAQTATAELEVPPLKPSALLQEEIAPEQTKNAPLFIQGQQMWGRPDLETVVEGEAELRKPGTVIRADRLEYDQSTDQVKAVGNVHINRNGNTFEGPVLELKIDAMQGFLDQPSYQFLQNDAHGMAERADFLDENHTLIYNASYTTCKRQPGPDWLPDWILRAGRIHLDNEEDVGSADDAVLSFKGIPVLPIPSFSFPLSDRRRSGVLPPVIGIDTSNGVEVTLPYYWNIAPNRDATITPKLMTQRGVDVGGEFRYLERSYNGTVRANYMVSDRLTSTDRWGLSYLHQGVLAAPVGSAVLGINVNRVSDDNYWRDFTGNTASEMTNTTTIAGAVVTQRLLPTDVVAAWGLGPFSSSVRMLRWQTLQDVRAPIVPPYDRAPQFNARYAQTNLYGLDWSLDGDLTQFESDRLRTLQPNALRSLAVVGVSRPWLSPAGFMTPKLQLHATNYQFDAALGSGARWADSVVPTFSLDSGLVFEREMYTLGHDLVQTLEPRAFYVYTPYRNQSLLPNYDTGVNDFNFATIFTENAFVGHDRIADNNLLTLGLTTRFLDAQSGAQFARFGIAQRLRFTDQQVTLDSVTAPSVSGLSDILLGATLNLHDRWVFDSTAQYNAKSDRSIRAIVGTRYSPGRYRVINAAYRFQRDSSEQMDVSWQWPLNSLWSEGAPGQDMGAGRGLGAGRYYSVGRLNYSINEGRLVDTILGVEYDAGCWLSRLVLERIYTSTSTSTSRLMFQLEFVGFTRFGIGPQKILSQNISRYQNLRETGSTVSRFNHYD